MLLKIIGIFIVVFGGWIISTELGFSETSKIIGAIVGTATLLILSAMEDIC